MQHALAPLCRRSRSTADRQNSDAESVAERCLRACCETRPCRPHTSLGAPFPHRQQFRSTRAMSQAKPMFLPSPSRPPACLPIRADMHCECSTYTRVTTLSSPTQLYGDNRVTQCRHDQLQRIRSSKSESFQRTTETLLDIHHLRSCTEMRRVPDAP